MSAPQHTLTWHVRDWMEHRHVPSYAALARALIAHGYPTSAAHAARLVNTPTQLSLPLLEALCRALECTPGDLLRTANQPPPIAKAPPRRVALPEPPPPRLPEAERRKVVGPPARALHAHALASALEPKGDK